MNPLILYFAATMIATSSFVQNSTLTNNAKPHITKKIQSVIPTQDEAKTWVVARSNEPLVHDGGSVLPETTAKNNNTTALNNNETINVASVEPSKSAMVLNK